MLVKKCLLGGVAQKHLLNHTGRRLRFDLLAILYNISRMPRHQKKNTCERDAIERHFTKWLQVDYILKKSTTTGFKIK